ncbi:MULTISPECIES: glycoside hydrolase family 66 protein [Arthrobacter]|uniref:Carbohydrate-binding protein n=1 Tax=Arthrobacter terricola TaxID=2547396 RepID=A0A4R5K6D0_9MICC|nr:MULTISPECIES: glycoside hydrolase family 66 protein [Arthrobacter]MBT8163504.1 carbohydrate-binding protein [Arthrobacter sp. GN70]TDF89451.1 carbohydrate-binding protein [Arthrobacter terricola]
MESLQPGMPFSRRTLLGGLAATAAASAASQLLAAAPNAHAAGGGPALLDVYTDKARYSPGETVQLTVELANPTTVPVTARLTVAAEKLGTPLKSAAPSQSVRMEAGQSQTATVQWQPPADDYQGYRVSVRLDAGGQTQTRSTAVDVSSDWAKFPRYGYVSVYTEGLDAQAVLAQLNRYHLNGLQFYDWQWKQHMPCPPTQIWNDLANRPVSGASVKSLIDAAHSRGMKAMFYDLAYGAFSNYDTDGSGVQTGWGIFHSPTTATKDTQVGFPLPSTWSTDRLYLFDPGNKDWQDHIFAQCSKVMDTFGFDGWHIDTIGNQGIVYDSQGNRVRIPNEYRGFLAGEKQAVGGRSLINPVGGYGLDQICDTGVDFIYNEVWESDGITTYRDLARQGDRVRANTTKALVMPAYMNKAYSNSTPTGTTRYFNEPSVLLTEATILAAGASHLAMGDGDSMLSHEYFPNKNLQLTDSLRAKLREYYDFQVAYQNLLRDGSHRAGNSAEVWGLNTSTTGSAGTVWLQAMSTGAATALHLINLLDNPSDHWRDDNADYPEPAERTDFTVKLYIADSTPNDVKVRFASPDRNSGAVEELKAKRARDSRGTFLTFTVPSLKYWDVIWLDTAAAALPVKAFDAFARNRVSENSFNAQMNIEPTSDAGGGLDGCAVNDGNYWAFTPMDFGPGAHSVDLRFATATQGGTVEFRIDHHDGPLIGQMAVGHTGGWQNWMTLTTPVQVSGQHALYIIFRGDVEGIGNVTWIQFH